MEREEEGEEERAEVVTLEREGEREEEGEEKRGWEGGIEETVECKREGWVVKALQCRVTWCH